MKKGQREQWQKKAICLKGKRKKRKEGRKFPFVISCREPEASYDLGQERGGNHRVFLQEKG